MDVKLSFHFILLHFRRCRNDECSINASIHGHVRFQGTQMLEHPNKVRSMEVHVFPPAIESGKHNRLLCGCFDHRNRKSVRGYSSCTSLQWSSREGERKRVPRTDRYSFSAIACNSLLSYNLAAIVRETRLLQCRCCSHDALTMLLQDHHFVPSAPMYYHPCYDWVMNYAGVVFHLDLTA